MFRSFAAQRARASLVLLPVLTATAAAELAQPEPKIPTIAPGSAYRQVNLLSDIPGFAPVLDPLLINPWGVSKGASTPFWIANNGTGTTQLVCGDVSGAPVVLNPALPTVIIPEGLPTGTVANPTATDFVLPGACASAPCGANFLFASITGNISGWDPNAPAAGSTEAVIAASRPDSVYTGLAIANNGSGNFLYAADFANGKIDVFNSSFALQPATSFPFNDATIPTASGNTYHPFNIQAIGSWLYVTYAKLGPGASTEAGVGNGFVRRFDANGVRDTGFAINNGALNSPWGVTVAPATFGIFGNALLVGNFGEGNPSIHAYNPTTGAFLGTLQDESGNGIVIDELWALTFGNGGAGGDVNTLYFTAGTADEEHGLFGKLTPTTATAASLIQFASADFEIEEGSKQIEVTLTRIGNVSGTATVNYNTTDVARIGYASQKSDYSIALGSVTFAPGETSKTVRILLVDDRFVEGSEDISLALTNPTGSGVGLGSPNTTAISILENDVSRPTTNPIDETAFFVRQQYLDFLNREPDSSGLQFWTNTVDSCGADAQCREVNRINVSGAFFLSIEFQNTGMIAYLTNRAAFGPNAPADSPVAVLYGQFMREVQQLQKGLIFGQPAYDAQLATNKEAYFAYFVARPEFVSRYATTQTPAQFVDALFATSGVTPSTAERDAAMAEFGGASDTSDQAARARALRRVAESGTLKSNEFNRVFVAMEYFGFLRRDPDPAGFNYWLAKLNSFNGNFVEAEMVKAFISSSEYRERFGIN